MLWTYTELKYMLGFGAPQEVKKTQMKSNFSKISVLLASLVRIIAILNENDITQAFTQGLLLKPLGSLIFHLAL